MYTLSHRWDLRSGEIEGDNLRKHERKYIDFIISGEPLSELLRTKEKDMISTLGWGSNFDLERQRIKEFSKQGATELNTGRTIIYGCAECGDIGCGAITVQILDAGDKIIWKDFGHETDYSGFDLQDYKHIPPFEFDKLEYLAEFEQIGKELSDASRLKR